MTFKCKFEKFVCFEGKYKTISMENAKEILDALGNYENIFWQKLYTYLLTYFYTIIPFYLSSLQVFLPIWNKRPWPIMALWNLWTSVQFIIGNGTVPFPHWTSLLKWMKKWNTLISLSMNTPKLYQANLETNWWQLPKTPTGLGLLQALLLIHFVSW